MHAVSKLTPAQAALYGLALAAFLTIGLPSHAGAYALGGVGPVIGAVDPDGSDGTVAIGANLDLDQADTQVHLRPNFIYWKENGLSDVNPNFDLYYHFAPAGQVSPYVGAGFGLHFYGTDGPGDPGTDPGANFFGGVLLPSRTMNLFFEGRYAATDRSQFGLFTGATFNVGH
jgi:hypothetical protein